ncbi:MAG TPA: hypothetical protein VGF45_15540 [Polyangia bacterium]
MPKLTDGTACLRAGECVSGTCVAYYRDQDGDGYGSDVPAKFCGTAPPSGYVKTNDRDCCDTDARAFKCRDSMPCGNTTPQGTKNNCQSFDYNCDGIEERSPTTYTDAGGCQHVSSSLYCTAINPTTRQRPEGCGVPFTVQTCVGPPCRVVPQTATVTCF